MQALTFSSSTGPQTSPRPSANNLNTIIKNDTVEKFSTYIANNPDEIYEVTETGLNLLQRLIEAQAWRCALYLVQQHCAKLDINKKDSIQKTALHYACENNQVELAKQLISLRAKLDESDSKEMTAFHIAVEKNNIELVQYFRNNLSAEIIVSIFQEHTLTPLHLAAQGPYECFSIVLQIISPSILNTKDNTGKTALHYAVTSPTSSQNTEALLNKHATINCEDYLGQTPLIIAIKKSNNDVATLLLNRGANANLGTPHPLVHAYFVNNHPLFSALLRYGAKDVRVEGHSFIDMLAACNATDFLELYNSNTGQKPSQNSFSLHSSQLGKDSDGNPTLHKCINKSNLLSFCYYLTHNNNHITEVNHRGKTALHLAVEQGSVVMVHFLLYKGINPQKPDNLGNTALHYLSNAKTKSSHDQYIILDLLLKNGANINTENNSGLTPVALAYQQKNKYLMTRLIEYGAAIDVKEETGKSLLEAATSECHFDTMQTLITRGATRNSESLVAACTLPHLYAVSLLLSPDPSVITKTQNIGPISKPANPNIKVAEQTALVIAIQQIHKRLTEGAFEDPTSMPKEPSETDEHKIFELLLEHNAKPNERSRYGERQITPLLLATELNLSNVVQHLLSNGAKAQKVDKLHPVTIACQKKFTDVLYELLRHGAKIPKKVIINQKSYSDKVQKTLEEFIPKQSGSFLGTLSRRASTATSRSASRERSRSNSVDASPQQSPRSRSQTLTSILPFDLSERLSKMQLSDTGEAQTLHEKIAAFNQTDTYSESVLREEFLRGDKLLFKEPKHLPKSLGRIGKSMTISINETPIIKPTDLYPESLSRDEKCECIITKLLTQIDSAFSISPDKDFQKAKIAHLSHMDGIDDKKIMVLKIYDGEGALVTQNLNLIPLWLTAKEAAAIAILPVQLQIRKYSEKNKDANISTRVIDQWERVDLTLSKATIVAVGSRTMTIQADPTGKQPINAATVLITATLTVERETGEITVKIERKNLTFIADVSLATKRHIYTALNAPLIS